MQIIPMSQYHSITAGALNLSLSTWSAEFSALYQSFHLGWGVLLQVIDDVMHNQKSKNDNHRSVSQCEIPARRVLSLF